MKFNTKLKIMMVGIFILSLISVYRCSSFLEEGMEERHRGFLIKKREFMDQCAADGNSKTECRLLYQEIGLLDDLL